VGLVPTTARAQVGGGAAVSPTSPATGVTGLYANPYMNPYVNPFLNPLMTQQPVSPGNAALYFFAAQQMTGGIGSGRISGSRPSPGTVPGAAGTPGRPGFAPGRPGENTANGNAPAARNSSNQPAAGAARYFNRDFPTTKPGPGRYYDRQTRYFPAIGR
jgi:hypothetical protein